MPDPSHNSPPPILSPRGTAFFLDLDGTLAEIVSDPLEARVAQETLDVLARLQDATRGAVAVVSGRSLVQLETMLHPLRLPMAGAHGAELRNGEGVVRRAEVDSDLLADIVSAVVEFTSLQRGLLAEAKSGSVALHYRKRPELETICRDFARELAKRDRRIRLLPGKMVIELTLAQLTKGDAIAEFMAQPPFAGRLPFFAGDDVTDEAGFGIVNGMLGVTVKVGAGATSANYRLASVRDVTRYLAQVLDDRAAGQGTE